MDSSKWKQDLKDLKDMQNDGILSDDEFAAEKANIMAKRAEAKRAEAEGAAAQTSLVQQQQMNPQSGHVTPQVQPQITPFGAATPQKQPQVVYQQQQVQKPGLFGGLVSAIKTAAVQAGISPKAKEKKTESAEFLEGQRIMRDGLMNYEDDCDLFLRACICPCLVFGTVQVQTIREMSMVRQDFSSIGAGGLRGAGQKVFAVKNRHTDSETECASCFGYALGLWLGSALLAGGNRQKLNYYFGVSERQRDGCGEACLVHLWCYACALSQELRAIEVYRKQRPLPRVTKMT